MQTIRTVIIRKEQSLRARKDFRGTLHLKNGQASDKLEGTGGRSGWEGHTGQGRGRNVGELHSGDIHVLYSRAQPYTHILFIFAHFSLLLRLAGKLFHCEDEKTKVHMIKGPC